MQDQINKTVADFQKLFPSVPVPPISWNPNMRTTAGKVRMNPNTRQVFWIQLNPHLLKNETDLDQTLMHELCHAADCVLYGKRGHGRTWRNLMRLSGRQVRRCHNYDVSNLKRKQKRYPARCKCRTYELSAVRFNRIQNGAVYSCKTCKEGLTLMSQFETIKVENLIVNGLKF